MIFLIHISAASYTYVRNNIDHRRYMTIFRWFFLARRESIGRIILQNVLIFFFSTRGEYEVPYFLYAMQRHKYTTSVLAFIYRQNTTAVLL